LMNSPTGTIPMAWLYRSPEYPTEPFSLTVGHWIPDLFPWSEFRQAATRKFAQELEGYRRSRIRIWGSNRTSVARQAKWTVLWQRGKTVTQIRSHYPKLHTRDVSPDGVLMGIRSFASSIGVTLREGSSGPRRRT
jgi:hypothetical protein